MNVISKNMNPKPMRITKIIWNRSNDADADDDVFGLIVLLFTFE